MITMVMVFMIMLFFGIAGLAIKLAWSLTRLIFGLGLFWFCPLLFMLAVLFGWFSHLWLPILIIGLLSGRLFRRV